MIPTTRREETTLEGWRDRLLQVRNKRAQPGRDDKILADWNGLLVAGLARAADHVSRESLYEAAARTYRFILDTMMTENGLAHAYRAGTMVAPGFSTDHAAMMIAAATLAETAPDPETAEAYLADAKRLADLLHRHYSHERGGYYLTSDTAEGLIVRPYSAYDEATPNGNAMAAEALVRLWHLTGDDVYRDRAQQVLSAFSQAILKNVFGTAGLLNAMDTLENGVLAVCVTQTGARNPDFDRALLALADPAVVRRTVSDGDTSLPDHHPAAGKTLRSIPTNRPSTSAWKDAADRRLRDPPRSGRLRCSCCRRNRRSTSSAQLVEQELDRVHRAHRIEDTAQHETSS
jgi:uncharacterized protein YyaL (SSP411 family)